jgi:putative transposase
LRLSLSKIGASKVKWHRLPEGRIKTGTIKREGTHWEVIFTCEGERALVYQPTEEVGGLDMGLLHFAPLDDGSTIENPRSYRRAESSLQAAQQVLSRKKRGSARRRKQGRLVGKHHPHIHNQRRDFHQKEARKLMNGHQIIVFEKVQPKNRSRRPKPKPAETPGKYLPNGASAKAGLNQSIWDAGWGQFQQLCVSKAEWAGSRVLFVDPQNTSQRCGRCGTIVPKDLDERWHSCPQCGLELDRDHHSALDIKRLGLLLLAQEHQARTVPSGDAPLRSSRLSVRKVADKKERL